MVAHCLRENRFCWVNEKKWKLLNRIRAEQHFLTSSWNPILITFFFQFFQMSKSTRIPKPVSVPVSAPSQALIPAASPVKGHEQDTGTIVTNCQTVTITNNFISVPETQQQSLGPLATDFEELSPSKFWTPSVAMPDKPLPAHFVYAYGFPRTAKTDFLLVLYTTDNTNRRHTHHRNRFECNKRINGSRCLGALKLSKGVLAPHNWVICEVIHNHLCLLNRFFLGVCMD